ncbi:MAG: nickel-dependent hydrogenase large subunit [Alphaproteobacteria bacterium]|nr:nickel-dependent hydrogenase large subunit [Alphaproteobacteria bacterium]
MTELMHFLADSPVVTRHRPWPRVELSAVTWANLVDQLAIERWELAALWGEPGMVHAALRDPDLGVYFVVSTACPDGRFASLARVRPGAARLERAARDLFGVVPEGLEDARPWLDHGRWPMRRPLAAAPVPRAMDEPAAQAADYPFLPVEGEGVHQIPVGPVHAGIIEPGHFRFHANGEIVVRLEERLGYVHRGVERLMQGKPVPEAARLASRVSGDSAVAHAFAFARAVEAALDHECPARATHLRALMAELERIANHLGDFGAICNDASFAFLQAEASSLREDVLRVAGSVFGHRLMMDKVVPGGVAVDIAAIGIEAIRALVGAVGPRFERLVHVYDSKPSLLDRTIATGAVGSHLVHRFAVGGIVGRAAGRAVDARVAPGYAPYDALDFAVPGLPQGDVHARIMVRVEEVRESLKLIRQILDTLPSGPIFAPPPEREGEGMGVVEGFRGDILTWVRLGPDGRVQRCFPRDPSWLQWPLLEAAIEGNIVADFPLCNKSFNCSYAGQDL